MTKRESSNGMPYVGDTHVRFADGEVATAFAPKRGSLFRKSSLCKLIPALMLSITAVSNCFVLDTRPSPWTECAVMEGFLTEPFGFLLLFR